MKILVTGASGFIGRQAITALHNRGLDVIAASRNAPALSSRIHWETVDLLAPGAARALIQRVRPSHLLHFAWNAEPRSFWTAVDNLDWCASSLSLVRAFAEFGGRRVVAAGSCAEYTWDRPLLSEATALTMPSTLYGISKNSLRQLLLAGAVNMELSVAWGRVFWLYGPKEQPGRLVSDVIRSLKEENVVACSDGRQERDFMHVTDAAEAFVGALLSDFEGTFNVGSGHAVAVREIVNRLASLAGRHDLVRFGARPTSPGDPPRLAADIANLTNLIGFKPKYSLQEGLQQTWQSRFD